jgi:hypothetical protein
MKSFLLLFLILISTLASAQKNYRDFYLYYGFAGLGSNIGKMEPTLRINGTEFRYTLEQNSNWGDQKPEDPQLICTGKIRTSSIDSILSLVSPLKDTSIFKSNPDIMSGGIYDLTIASGRDSLNFELINTFDSVPLKIINILNPYLPSEHKLYAPTNLMKYDEDFSRFVNNKRYNEKKEQLLKR